MYRIKICGVTGPRDAEAAVAAGADAVGINFFRGSPRFVAPEAAAAIARAAGGALVVGVFVDERPATVLEVCRVVGLSAVQLAGDEAPEDAARISLPRIKTVRLGAGRGLDAVPDYPCEAFLVDAGNRGEYGGTGRPLDWSMLGGGLSRGVVRGRPWILAGGLTPGNVARAIGSARPAGVDVASGVESSPGKKDPEMMRLFVANARGGFERAGA